MRTLRILTALTLVSLITGTARADGLLYQLPKDGSWVAFDFQTTSGMKLSLQGALYMASVGQTTEGDDLCRWIELKWEATTNQGAEYTFLFKLLIPEKYLKKGESPLNHVVRVWRKSGDGDVRELEPSRIAGRLNRWLAGPA